MSLASSWWCNPTFQRWTKFLFGTPTHFLDYIVTADLSNTWRRHVVWAKKNGEDIRAIVTARYTSSTVFMSLLVSSEIGIVYSPSKPADAIREALLNRRRDQVEYWLGVLVCVAVFVSVAALIANFTAWSVFSALSKQNAPTILRSSLGLYAAQLPSRLVTISIYIFLLVVILTFWILMPGIGHALALAVPCIGIILHIVNTFSAISGLIMSTGAMGEEYILKRDEEEKMSPTELSDKLLELSQVARKADIPIMRQYLVHYQRILRDLESGALTTPVDHDSFAIRIGALRRRTDDDCL